MSDDDIFELYQLIAPDGQPLSIVSHSSVVIWREAEFFLGRVPGELIASGYTCKLGKFRKVVGEYNESI